MERGFGCFRVWGFGVFVFYILAVQIKKKKKNTVLLRIFGVFLNFEFLRGRKMGIVV